MVRVRQSASGGALSSGSVGGGGCSGCLAAAPRWSWTVRTPAGRLLFAGDAPEGEAPAEFDALIAELKKGPTDERFVAELFDQVGTLKRKVTFAAGGGNATDTGAGVKGMSTGVKVAIGLGIAGVLYLAWRRLRG